MFDEERRRELNEDYYRGTKEVCGKCGELLRFVLISTDVDGNRPEHQVVCVNLDCEDCV